MTLIQDILWYIWEYLVLIKKFVTALWLYRKPLKEEPGDKNLVNLGEEGLKEYFAKNGCGIRVLSVTPGGAPWRKSRRKKVEVEFSTRSRFFNDWWAKIRFLLHGSDGKASFFKINAVIDEKNEGKTCKSRLTLVPQNIAANRDAFKWLFDSNFIKAITLQWGEDGPEFKFVYPPEEEKINGYRTKNGKNGKRPITNSQKLDKILVFKSPG
ncbi:MAG: hypothetical protein PHD51_02240 [Patescibacteria group bacterium]|nr:hypothetical protein [Patescibacteria group bacterium]MDD5490319.1 hypothetical protein [Patescibacteria group bacterium]